MESLVYGTWLFELILTVAVVGFTSLLWCAFTACVDESPRGRDGKVLSFFVAVAMSLLTSVLIYTNGQSGRGTVLTERDLIKSKTYEVLYSSENPVEGGYLVVVKERREKENDKRNPRVYLLSVKPKTSFSIKWVNDIIKYSDAAEVR